MKQRLAFLSCLIGLSASWAAAQVPAGTEFRINTSTTGHQRFPAVAESSVGNFVVAWQGYPQDGSSYGVLGQRYDASGTPVGGEFQVNTYTFDYQGNPQPAFDQAGNFVVVWSSYPQDGSNWGVFGQRYDTSGAPRAGEFQLNTYTTGAQVDARVAVDGSGNFVVVWQSNGQDGSGDGIFGQRYDASGAPRGAEFQVNTYTANEQRYPSVAASAAGSFVVAWQSYGQGGIGTHAFARTYDAAGVPRGAEFQVGTFGYRPSVASDAAGDFVVAWTTYTFGSSYDVFAQRFGASGTPQGAEFQVNTYTTGGQSTPSVASDAAGNFVVAWQSNGQDGSGYGVFGQRYDASGTPRGSEFQVNSSTGGSQAVPRVASDAVGNFVVTWDSYGYGSSPGAFGQRFGGLEPTALAVDTVATTGSDGNSVLEPGETVDVKPSWSNVNGLSQTFASTATGFIGPPASGVSYSLPDATGDYGTVANGTTAQCTDCFQVRVGSTGTRPATHWDAVLTERITPDAQGQTKLWTVHVGESFTDVPKTSGFYRFVETLLHKGVTGGCTSTTYCPASSVTREQMAVFALVAKQGSGWLPPACTTPTTFADVPANSPFCRWIEELARRGVVAGCGGENYCPSAEVSREQMPVFMLRTLEAAISPPACTTPKFADVPASSPFCPWIEELARRNVVGGCGGGDYCPAAAVSREQMGVFVSLTFGLTLYGP